MKIIGLILIRNESEIIVDTLNHMSEFCDEIFIYDDVSTDNTVSLCKSHQSTTGILEGTEWIADRYMAETYNRQALLEFARTNSDISPDDWFIYMDADERIDFRFDLLEHNSKNIDGIKLRLFDFYITPDDVDKSYIHRTKIGPEYRDILFLFKNKSALGYTSPIQRECRLVPNSNVILQGHVKHYGKSISIEQWEETCDFYIRYFPKYSDKWKSRKGKAIHTKSDFGNPLITWDERWNDELLIKI